MSLCAISEALYAKIKRSKIAFLFIMRCRRGRLVVVLRTTLPLAGGEDGVDRVNRVDVLAALDGDCLEERCFLIASYAHSYHVKRDQDKIHYSRK